MFMGMSSGKYFRAKPQMRWFQILYLSYLLIWLLNPWHLASEDFQGSTHLLPLGADGINYLELKASNPLSRLQSGLDRGAIQLSYDKDKGGYLPALMQHLGIPASSQILVGSKTSLQRERISPNRPRAILFNDDIYLGYVPGSKVIELSVADPIMGGVFYTLEASESGEPIMKSPQQCLECHASSKTMGVPGHLVRSFRTDARGQLDLSSDGGLITHRTPFSQRWGGYFVTGMAGPPDHRGNQFGGSSNPHLIETLEPRISLADYPGEHSDIVALMILDHQTHLHNFIARLHHEARMAMQTYGHIRYLRHKVDSLVDALLFANEAPITRAIKGSSGFSQWFETQGVQDPQGRSLRQLDLHTRMMRYPCSYLIHSQAFKSLPDPVYDATLKALWEVLTGQTRRQKLNHLTLSLRREIHEILEATLHPKPEYW